MRVWLHRHLGRFKEASPLVLASGLTLLCVPAVVALAWMATEQIAVSRIEAAIQRQTLQIARQLTDSETDLEVVFGQARSITTWIAEEGRGRAAILNPAEVMDANVFLHGVATSFGLDLIYVVNAKGISVAASNWDTPASTVGMDFNDCDHFLTSITGIPGQQFAVGRSTRAPGFFFSMPIRNGSEVIGTVGVKIDQPRLQHLLRIAGSVISDEYGVVVLAENPKYLFNTLPGATVGKLGNDQRTVRYARTSFDPLPTQPAGLSQFPDVQLFDGQPVLLGSRTLIDAGLQIYVASGFDALHDVRAQRKLLFSGGAIAATLLIWGLWLAALYFLRARDYRRRLETANRQLSCLNSELHQQATHDFLTGALNRRAFNALLGNELERLKRYGGELSLGVIDLDRFKRVNDERGHEVGDLTLKFLVDFISRTMRRSDILARLGGEEFCLLMPNTSPEEGARVIDRMRETVSITPVPDVVPELLFTFSAGVAGWTPGMSDPRLSGSPAYAGMVPFSGTLRRAVELLKRPKLRSEKSKKYQ